MLFIMNIILVISALIGMYLISNVDKRGFVVFTLVEFSMGYIGWATRNYGLVIAAFMYLCMNVYSWFKWSKR